MKNKSQKPSHNRRIIWATIAIATILIAAVTLFYYYPHEHSQPKAAIIDQLGSSDVSPVSRNQNQTFIAEAQNLLHTRFSEVDYYSDNATVDNYKTLPSSGYKLIVWRAHSALDLASKYIAISTSETPGFKSYDEYSDDQLTLCNITDDPQLYWAITPKFIEECMEGRFEDTVIILMSCNGLKAGYNKTAEAFIQKGAKVFISWDGWIESPNNDYGTLLLLQRLIARNSTIGEAVEDTPTYDSPIYGPSKLDYYPHTEVAGYRIPNYTDKTVASILGFNTLSSLWKLGIERDDHANHTLEADMATSLSVSAASKRSRTIGCEEAPP
jgi:hypothetical protein